MSAIKAEGYKSNSTDDNRSYLVKDPADSQLDADVIDMNCLPKVSFCIPTLNNEDTIDRCLKSISDQDYPDIEIIIVDGYSRDRTVDISLEYTSNIYHDSGTYGSACQTGVEHSKGCIIALFDSDIILPHCNWLKDAVKYFNYSDRVSTVWPLCVAPPNASLFQRLYQTNMHGILIENRIANNHGLFGGGNSLILKRYIEEIGGIDRSIHWGADFDWAKKLKDLGYQVVFISDPLYHDTMRSLRLFAKKQFNGARTFTKKGFNMMGLSRKDIFYEQFVLGTKGMIKGILVDKDRAWLLYPVFILIRVTAYAYIAMKSIASQR
jgi:glycosyltransferase involved in cell wall biosynthesis